MTSVQLVQGYFERIESLNDLLHSVIETNPDRDMRRRATRSRSDETDTFEGRSTEYRFYLRTTSRPLMKIAEPSHMETTAGSLALVGSRVPGDAVIVHRLRNAGAVILGKTNLGEWANFRGSDIAYPLAVGWSARGGEHNQRIR